MHEATSEAGLGLLEQAILWAGFLGAWLLVAGPLHQARLELSEEEFERERIESTFREIPPPPPLSAWWWLVPPLRLYLGHRRRDAWQREFLVQLSQADFEAVSSYFSKARGWLLVGAGGLLIATKETFELVEGNHWPRWLFWSLLVVMATLSALNVVRQSVSDARLAAERARLRAEAQPE